MKFGRSDYNERIIDKDGKIPEDEPCFLLRGQDQLAPRLLLTWAMELRLNGGDVKMAQEAENHAQEMLLWQKTHKVKTPDMYRGSAQMRYIKDQIISLISEIRNGSGDSKTIGLLSKYIEQYYNNSDSFIVFLNSDLKRGALTTKFENQLNTDDFDLDEDSKLKSFDAKLIVYCNNLGKLFIVEDRIS